MATIVSAYLLFLLITIKALPEQTNSIKSKRTKVSFLFLMLLFILFAGLRKKGIDSDYITYMSIYDEKLPMINEPSFLLIAYVFRDVFRLAYSAVVVFYAVLSLSPKYKAIITESSFCYLSLLVLLSDLFLLQDFTQIRVAVATGIFLVSIKYLYYGQKNKYIICSLVAICFHLSSIIMLPLIVLNPKKINKYHCYLLLFVSFCFALLKINPVRLLLFLPDGFILDKAVDYLSKGEDYTANIFSVYAISKLFILVLLLFKSSVVQRTNKYSCLLLKIQTLSCCSLMLFSQNMAAALRVSEFYSIVDILLFPLFVSIFKEKKIAKIILIFLCLIWLTMRIFRYRLIKII